MKVTSLENTKLFNFTKKVYTIIENKQFSGLWKYKLDGYTDRWFPSPFLMKVDTPGIIPLGSDIQKSAIDLTQHMIKRYNSKSYMKTIRPKLNSHLKSWTLKY